MVSFLSLVGTIVVSRVSIIACFMLYLFLQGESNELMYL